MPPKKPAEKKPDAGGSKKGATDAEDKKSGSGSTIKVNYIL